MRFRCLDFGGVCAVLPGNLAQLRKVPLYPRVTGFHIVEMDAIRLAAAKDGLGRCRQAVCFLSPAQVIRYLNDPNAEAIGDALEGSMRLHVPFDGIKVILHVLARREIPLVIFEGLDHWRPCLGWDIQVLRQRLDARDDVGVPLGVE